MAIILPVHTVVYNKTPTTHITYTRAQLPKPLAPLVVATKNEVVPLVPFYSQFKDITSTKWQKVGCGVTSLAMIIDYYSSETISVNTLLTRGIASGAYADSTGWAHQGLISLSKKYNLNGSSYDVSDLKTDVALTKLESYVDGGPVMASVHYKFDPKSTIPHLVVITGIKDGTVYYNDPAAKQGDLTISILDFQKSWKKKFIVIRPEKKSTVV